MSPSYTGPREIGRCTSSWTLSPRQPWTPPSSARRTQARWPALHGGRVGHAAGGRHQDSKWSAGSRHQGLHRSAALQGAKADTTLLASYATNATLSASETTLQSALDAILAELAALQLSGSGGVVNAPAWAGFTTGELVRGSNVVRNLPLSAALANGDDTLSIRAVGRLPHRGSAGRGDDQRHHGRAAGLLHLLTSRRAVGRPAQRGRRRPPSRARCWPTGRARTRTSSQPTKSPRRWWRTVQPQTRTRRRP